jgi:hypothetical protein
MRNVVRQRRREMRQEDGQTARHIIVFVFLSSASAFWISVKPRISKRKASSEACSLWSELLAKPTSDVDLSCGFPQVPPSETTSPQNSRPAIVTAFGLAVSVDINVLRARAVDVDRL